MSNNICNVTGCQDTEINKKISCRGSHPGRHLEYLLLPKDGNATSGGSVREITNNKKNLKPTIIAG